MTMMMMMMKMSPLWAVAKRASQKAPHRSAAYTTSPIVCRTSRLTCPPIHRVQLRCISDGSGREQSCSCPAGALRGLVVSQRVDQAATYTKKDLGFKIIYHADPYCNCSLEMLKSVRQKSVATCHAALRAPSTSLGFAGCEKGSAAQQAFNHEIQHGQLA